MDRERQAGWQRDEDEIDRLVDEFLAGRQETGSGEADEVLSRVRALADEPLPAASRRRHLATIATAGRRSRGTGWVAALQRRTAVVGAAALVLVMLAGGAVGVAQEADPDSPLYGLKRGSEEVWLALPRSGERRAEVHLAIADRRMDEADRAPHHAGTLVAAAIANVENAAEEKPEEAVRRLGELVQDPDRHGGVAKAALHRNCLRIAGHHGLDDSPCGPAPDVMHPGRGRWDEQRGWGPGGRPEGEVGPPPHVRDQDADDLDK